MGKFSLFPMTGGMVLLVCVCVASGAKDEKDSNNGGTKAQTISSKTTLKRETLPISAGGKTLPTGKSLESLRTASQTLFGYNGQNGFGFGGQGGQFGFSPSYSGGGGRQGFGGGGGFGQYNQNGGAYNVLDQNQGFFGAAQGSPYYNNGYFGGGGFNGYPYASTGGAGQYPFGSPQGGFGGGFGGIGQGYYPGFQGQIANRNYGFVNQGFGNPAFRNPSQGGVIGGSSGISSIPSSVQVGTGLEVGSRGFNGGSGAYPSASGQQYIVGNGIGQPAFISSSPSPGFGLGLGPGPYGMYTPGVPGGLYRDSMFGPYSLSGTPPPPTSSISSRPSSGATRLQTSGPNRFYQGAGPGGSYAPSSRERLYRFTSSNES